MNVTYERSVDHCEPTKYAKEVTVKSVVPGVNSDSLVVLSFEELGWKAVTSKDKNVVVGDKLFFIPTDSVLPLELGELLGINKYLSKGKVKPAKFRGNRSEGLVVEKEIVEPWLPYIMKWDDLPDVTMRGELLSSKEVPFEFVPFYKMPNLLNEPDTFKEGEIVFVSEKIHGTNARFGKMLHPETNEPVLYIGSHNTVQKPTSGSVYVETINRLMEKIGGFEKLPLGVEFFCEIFGSKIQHLSYERTVPDVRVFATLFGMEYDTPETTMRICESLDVPTVKFHKIVFNSIDEMRTLSDAPSEYTNAHHREGIVIRAAEEGGRMAKLISIEYLSGNKRTERH